MWGSVKILPTRVYKVNPRGLLYVGHSKRSSGGRSMKSWKIRLGLMLTMLAMLLAVSVPASAQDFWVEYAPGECWVDEWGSTWCPWDPALVAPAAAPVAAPVVDQVDEDEDDDFADFEEDFEDFEDFAEDFAELEEDLDGDFDSFFLDEFDCDDDDD